MKTIFLLILCLYFVNANVESYIEGGLSEPFSHPYVVSVQFRIGGNFMHICGGVILAPDWVLTAARCFIPASHAEVLSGKFDLQVYETGQQRRGVAVRNTVQSVDGNLAMLNLATSFMFDGRTNKTTFAQSERPGDTARLIGWPTLFEPSQVPQIQAQRTANLRILNPSNCPDFSYRPLNAQTEFCTESIDGSQACDGSLGSPLIEENSDLVLGVLFAHPNPCNETNRSPAAYARVSSYRRWIDQTMRK